MDGNKASQMDVICHHSDICVIEIYHLYFWLLLPTRKTYNGPGILRKNYLPWS
jgi:hypothetical protein